MWEIIQANRRKSLVIFFLMGVCLVGLGFVIGAALFPEGGGFIGIALAVMIWGILSAISYFSGDSIVLMMSGAVEVTPDMHPQLFNVVEEMKIAAGLPVMPKVYIINDRSPNAFATGRSPERSAIAVTSGLLERVNRDELQGVVAHEMGHIINRDVMFVTFAGIMLGSIVLISEVFLRGMWFSGGGSSRRYKSDKSGSGNMYLAIIAIVLAILAPIMARLLYFALSRKREYLADATAARLTRYPEGLASALQKISSSTEEFYSANKVTAPMYIYNPADKEMMQFSSALSTHPPVQERIKILRAMSFGVNYGSYQRAFQSVNGAAAGLMPASGLKDNEAVNIRKPSLDLKSDASKKTKAREVGDMMRAANGFVFIACIGCRLRMKIPPNFKQPQVKCPRCGTENKVPIAELAAIAAIAEALPGIAGKGAGQTGTAANIASEGQKYNTYTRQTKGWETFLCSCGAPVQLSPSFSASQISCKSCGRKTIISNN